MSTPLTNTMIYLLGFPGTGKYTIAKELAKQAQIRIVDNHLINNPVFSLLRINGKTKIPTMVWDYTDRVWEVVADTMINLADKDENFVLTNFLLHGDAGDTEHFESVAAVARARQARFIPVRLDMSSNEEHVRRMTSQDRADRLKLTDTDKLQEYAGKHILKPDHPHCLTIDVTALSAEEAARQILQYAGSLAV